MLGDKKRPYNKITEMPNRINRNIRIKGKEHIKYLDIIRSLV